MRCKTQDRADQRKGPCNRLCRSAINVTGRTKTQGPCLPFVFSQKPSDASSEVTHDQNPWLMPRATLIICSASLESSLTALWDVQRQSGHARIVQHLHDA